MTTAEARRLKAVQTLADAHAMADRFLRDAQAARSRRRSRAPRAAGRTKEERDAATKAETARIRFKCMTRAGGWGELCGRPMDADQAEMCHLDGGSGKRTRRQSVQNCLMEHHECHQGIGGFDRLPLTWFGEVARWAARHGYPLPERFRKLAALAEVNHG